MNKNPDSLATSEPARRARNLEIINNMPPEHRSDFRPAQAQARQLGRLSVQERTQLKKCEQMIERSLNSFVELGRALAIIKNQRLYRADFPTFRAYMTARWAFKASRARQLISAASVYEDVQSVTNVTPANEAQLRPLVPLPADTRREVWQLCVETYGTPTEDTVRQVVAQVVKMEPHTPQRMQDFWELFRELTTRLDDTTKWINQHNVGQAEIPEDARRHLQRLLGAIRDLLRF